MFNRKSGKKFIFLLFIGLLIVAAISLTCGQIKIPLHNTLSAIGYQLGLPFFDKNDFTQEQMAVVWYIRMPRMVVGLLVGAALDDAAVEACYNWRFSGAKNGVGQKIRCYTYVPITFRLR